jgi:fermentation-respiration switch protein FrsA (DUF1100 family)
MSGAQRATGTRRAGCGGCGGGRNRHTTNRVVDVTGASQNRAMRRLSLPAALLATAVALGACGSTVTTTPPSAPPEASTAAPRALAPIKGSAPDRTFDIAVRRLTVRRDDRTLGVTIWYPNSAGPFPVVLFSHGLGAAPTDYRPLLARWATAGFVVVAPTYPLTSRDAPQVNVLDVLNQPADATAVLDHVLALNTRSGDALRGRLATDRVAAAGHSAGGVTTVGLFTVARDPRLRSGLVLAGSALGVGTEFTGAAVPMLFVHGQRDTVIKYADGRAAYDAVPWPKAMLTLPGAGHGEALLDSGDGGFSVVANTTLEFLRWTLYGDAAAKRRLPADARKGGVARLDNNL